MLLQLVAGFIRSSLLSLKWGRPTCALIAISPVFVGGFIGISRAATCEIKPFISEIGKFDSSFINEASGLALGPDGQSFFVTNDSGDTPRFFQTRLSGEILAEFRMVDAGSGSKPWKVFDVEALSVGPCPNGLVGQCVAIADIGDNRDRRKSVEIGFFRIDRFPQAGAAGTVIKADMKVDLKLKLKYPDGPRNAEGFAILNSKFGLIVTKEQDRKARATMAAGVYVIDFETSKVERVATWDVPRWVGDQGLSALVTDISVDAGTKADGSASTIRVLLLTYKDVFELVVSTDLLDSATAKKRWPPKTWTIESRHRVSLDSAGPALLQQESITYDASRVGFYYSTEVPFALLGTGTAPIRWAQKVTCP